MRRSMTIGAVASLAALAGCQTMDIPYTRFAPGPELEMSKARCEIVGLASEQGVVAWGSAGYVAGAQLGNAIANEIRRREVIKHCMTLHGWRQAKKAS